MSAAAGPRGGASRATPAPPPAPLPAPPPSEQPSQSSNGPGCGAAHRPHRPTRLAAAGEPVAGELAAAEPTHGPVDRLPPAERQEGRPRRSTSTPPSRNHRTLLQELREGMSALQRQMQETNASVISSVEAGGGRIKTGQAAAVQGLQP